MGEPLQKNVVGEWGIRDRENPCSEFAPTVAALTHSNGLLGLRITAPGDGQCMSDGHYACMDCYELSRESHLFDEDQS